MSEHQRKASANRAFLGRQGSIKVGAGSAVEDVLAARARRGELSLYRRAKREGVML